jgi:outer membrane protein assembly factor BamA
MENIARRELESNGYFKEEVTTAATEVKNETATRRYIAATLRIREGEQYRLKQIKFENNKVISATELRHAFPIEDGDIANNDKIEQGVRAMAELYAGQGYMQTIRSVKTSLNDETSRTRMLTFRVDVQEGPQFTVAGLTLEGSREWPADKAEKLQTVARQYEGSHNVGVFIEAVKQTMRDIFPGCDADALVGVTEGGEIPHATVNVTWPEDFQRN